MPSEMTKEGSECHAQPHALPLPPTTGVLMIRLATHLVSPPLHAGAEHSEGSGSLFHSAPRTRCPSKLPGVCAWGRGS